MIKLRDAHSRQTHYVAPAAIARISEAGVSSQWHGVRSIVRTFDGAVLEVCETPEEIARELDAAKELGL